MPDVPIIPTVDIDDDFADKLRDLRDRLDDRAHVVVTGSAKGNLRRPALFIITAAAIVLGLPVVAIVTLVILALTDQVVEL